MDGSVAPGGSVYNATKPKVSPAPRDLTDTLHGAGGATVHNGVELSGKPLRSASRKTSIFDRRFDVDSDTVMVKSSVPLPVFNN